MLVALYLLTASYTHMKDNDQPVEKTQSRFFAHKTQDVKLQDCDVVCTPAVNQVNRKKSDQSAEPNERRLQRIKIVKSVKPSKKHVQKTIQAKSRNSFCAPQENNVYPWHVNDKENSLTDDQVKEDGERQI